MVSFRVKGVADIYCDIFIDEAVDVAVEVFDHLIGLED